jgi:hypothetical protein
LLSSMPKRTFLLHNVHQSEPVLFKTRWTMSYLRGPLGREELSALAAPARQAAPVGPAPVSGPSAVTATASASAANAPASGAASVPMPPSASATASSPSATAPVLDPSIPQYFAPGDGTTWSPFLLGAARIEYSDAKLGVNETHDVVVLTPLLDGPVTVDWEHAEPAEFGLDDLSRTPQHARTFAPLPAPAANAKKYAQWTRDFTQWAARSQTLELLRGTQAGLVSHADESERDFRIRLQTTLREERDAELTKVRDRYAAKLATIDDRIRRAQAAVQREERQASESKLQAGVSMAATIFGAMLGRKAVSASTLGRATTAARGVTRIGRESQDVERAQAEVKAQQAKRDELTQKMQDELQALTDRWALRDEPLDRVVVKPKRGGTSVQLVALVWQPR